MDNKFLEAYIHLEKLCSEIYGEEHGISKYIQDMENTEYRVQSRIPMWTNTYKKLKELRWKRNQFVHEGVTEFNASDIEWLIEFYQLIMKGADPLSLREKRTEIRSAGDKERYIKRSNKPSGEDNSSRWTLLMIVGAVVLALLIVLGVVICLGKTMGFSLQDYLNF